MFTRSANLISSDKGFSVQVVGRGRVEYREAGRAMHVASEILVNSTIVVFTFSIKSWLPPHATERVTPEDKQRILTNIRSALEYSGRRVEIDEGDEPVFAEQKPLTRLSSPVVGILDLVGDRVAKLVAEDRRLLTGLFTKVQAVSAAAPKCDVLFVYADLTPEGALIGLKEGLRELIRDSGARIVVVASENPGLAYTNAGTRKPYGSANLVMTMQRNGTAFSHFFEALFSKMKRGVSMPDAWMELAPQRPGGLKRVDHPSTIFACELGKLTFG